MHCSLNNYGCKIIVVLILIVCNKNSIFGLTQPEKPTQTMRNTQDHIKEIATHILF